MGEVEDEPTWKPCPKCSGRGYDRATLLMGAADLDKFGVWSLHECGLCDGKGFVSPAGIALWRAGKL